jgi:Asp-tRNA(Asn)/Glu-tRNA(Gln) amidotransferase C subunit
MNKKPKSPVSQEFFENSLFADPVKTIAESESFSFSPEKEKKSALSLAEILTSVSKTNPIKKTNKKTLTSLYDRAKEIAMKREQKSESIFRESHPFRPKLNKLSEKMIKTAQQDGIDLRHSKNEKKLSTSIPQPSPDEEVKAKKQMPISEFVEKYNSMIQRTKKKHIEPKFVDKLDRVDGNCTFKPSLNVLSMTIAKDEQLDIYTKSVRDLAIRKEKIEREQMMKVVKELNECTFSPRIIRNYERSPRPSVEYRSRSQNRGYSRNSRSVSRTGFNTSLLDDSDYENHY